MTTLTSILPDHSTTNYGFEKRDISCNPKHTPVLVQQIIDGLMVKSGGSYVDGTLGGGGHTEKILRHCAPNGKVLAFDLDLTAIKAARDRFKQFTSNLSIIYGSYSNMRDHAHSIDFGSADGVLLDLGFSSIQLDSSGKGFSFLKDEPLDMRFDTTGPKASDLVNNMPEKELALLIYRYGEERKSRVIARAIINNRPIHSSSQLGNLIISYHSLEDRMVKTVFREGSSNCICPPDLDVCGCQHKASIQLVTRKVVRPTFDEVLSNPRSRSAKLRIVQKLPKEITHKS